MSISFKSYVAADTILEAADGHKSHMTHIEDRIVYGGPKGADQIVRALESLLGMIDGSVQTPTNLSVKVDGCVSPDTIVMTSVGEMQISECIQRHLAGETIAVLARDLSRKIDTMTPLLGGIEGPGDKGWIKIELENGSHIKLTEDHEVFLTSGEWVAAGNLSTGDDIHQII